MAELTFKSAGVSTREIDLSGPTAVRPQGVPAGIVGTSQKGPAFVPITVATYQDFVAEFGGTDGKKFGPLAMNEWMRNARSGTYVRVLGVGNAKKRGSDGEVTNAGFVVGDKLPQNLDDPSGPGIVGLNPYASEASAAVDWDGTGLNDSTQIPGRTYFLGALMREAYGDEGGVAAASTLTITTPLAAADFHTAPDDGRGIGVEYVDSTGADSLTIWFHEGSDDGLDADGVAILPPADSKNVYVSVGSRSGATVEILDLAELESRFLQLTDVLGNTLTIDFVDDDTATVGSDVVDGAGDFTVGAGTATLTLDTDANNVGSAATVAADIALSINTSDWRGTAVHTPGETSFILRLDDFGPADDEPDGGAILGGGMSVTGLVDTLASPAEQNINGGLNRTAAEIAAAAITQAAGTSANLSLSVNDADQLVVTQATVGNNGNDDAPDLDVDGDPGVDDVAGNAQLLSGAKRNVATLAVSMENLCDNDEVIELSDVDGNTISISFLDADTVDSAANQVRAARNVQATIQVEVDSGGGADLKDGDTLTLTDSAATSATLLVTPNGGGGALYLDDTAGGVIIDMDHGTFDSSDVQGMLIGALNDGFFTPAVTASDEGDGHVTITDDAPDATGNNAEVTAASFTDGNDISLAVANFSGGITAATNDEMAAEILSIINDATGFGVAATEGDSADTIVLRQAVAGAVTTEGVADSAGDPIGDGKLVRTSVTTGAAGTRVRNSVSGGALTLSDGSSSSGLTAIEFTGGGDTGEDPAPEHGAWADAGIDTSATGPLGGAWPIIRAVMYTPAGVRPSLVGAQGDTAGDADTRQAQTPNSEIDQYAFTAAGGNGPAGARLGSVCVDGTQERFVLLLNGHTPSPEYPAVLTASMDPQAPDYFMNVLNHDSACIEKAGHYVHAHYNVYQSYATVDAEGLGPVVAADPVDDRSMLEAAFLLHGVSDVQRTAQALDADANEPDIIDYESHEDRFRTARSPWVTSQVFGGKAKNLFRLHALDDGVAGSGKFKISIEGVMMDSNGGYGTFDLLVRSIRDDDTNVVAYEKFLGLDLNPSSERYIARVIGDQHMWYDFDKREGSQKLVVDGIHPNRSKYIRVEMNPEVDAGTVAAEALPMGYRGYWHLWTDMACLAADSPAGVTSTLLENEEYDSLGLIDGEVSPLCFAKEPPVPMRRNISVGTASKRRPDSSLYWGTMFQVDDDQDEPNKNLKFNAAILSHGKYFPMYHSSSLNPWVGDNEGAEDQYGSVVDADRFNNNMFSLERIQVVTKNPTTVSKKNPSVYGKVDGKQWAVAEYRRDGVLNTSIQTLEGLNILDEDGTPHADVETSPGDPSTATVGSRFLDPKTDLVDPGIRRFAKFSFFLQGGFDGTNIFRKEKDQLLNEATVWEMGDVANQGGTSGATVSAYRKAIDVMAEKADVDIKLLAIPGLRSEAVTDYAIDAVESRFDAMYIMDVEERSVDNNLMLDYSSQKPGVNLTVENFSSRNIDSSFAAAYFPDVIITDPATQSNVQCPPSVAVLGAFSLNDAVAHPWFAPAGFTRGALKTVVETQVKLSRANLDTLYESDVNPLAAFPHTPGVVVWGQKTLQQAKSALDRVNVRRLLIEIRREVRKVGNNLLFEPNRAETLARFSSSVNPILQRIQAQQGLDKFKVIIDTTTTTQADIENNTVRGKIFLQPTRTVEFISLDFVVTNAGMEV